MAVTPGHTTVTGSSADTRPIPARVVPPVELPAGPHELASAASALLDWDGVVLPQTTLFGRRVCLVARLRMDVHAERIAMGAGPAADKATASTWTWPEFAGTAPAPAVEIAGVLAVTRHWRTALASLVPFVRYGETAMVLPASAVLTEDYVDNCLPRARAYGVGVVTADSEAAADLDLAGRFHRPVADEDAISRWTNEVAYAQMLADTGADESAAAIG